MDLLDEIRGIDEEKLKKQFEESAAKAKEIGIIEYALTHLKRNENGSGKKENLRAFIKLIQYLYETSKIYDGNSIVSYFLQLIDASRKDMYILDSFGKFEYASVSTLDYKSIDKMQPNNYYWSNYKKEIEAILKGYVDALNEYSFWKTMPIQIVKGYLPILAKKDSNVNLKPFFEKLIKDFEENVEHKTTPRIYIWPDFVGNLVLLMVCMKDYHKYFSVEDKARVGQILIRQIKDKAIQKEENFHFGNNDFFQTSRFRISKDKNNWINQKYGISDYVDIFSKYPKEEMRKKARHNKSSNNSVEENQLYYEDRIFDGIETAFHYSNLAYIYCLLYDKVHISKYIDLIIDIDCPIVGFWFIKNEQLNEIDTRKILTMLKNESPSLYLQAIEEIKIRLNCDGQTDSKENHQQSLNNAMPTTEEIRKRLLDMTLEKILNECSDEEKLFIIELLEKKSKKLTITKK